MLTRDDISFLRRAIPIGFKFSDDEKKSVDHFVMRGYLSVKIGLKGNTAVLTPKGENTLKMIEVHPGWANRSDL